MKHTTRRLWDRWNTAIPYMAAGAGGGVALWSFVVTGDVGKGLWALQAALWAVIVILQDRTIRKVSPAHARLGRIITDTEARVIRVDMLDRGEVHTLHRFVERREDEENNHGS